MPRPNRPCRTVMCSSMGCQWGGTLVPAASLILSVNGAPACDGSPSTTLTCGGSASANAGVPSMRSDDMGVQRNESGLTAICAAGDEDDAVEPGFVCAIDESDSSTAAGVRRTIDGRFMDPPRSGCALIYDARPVLDQCSRGDLWGVIRGPS